MKRVSTKKPGKKWKLFKSNFATNRLAHNFGKNLYDTTNQFYLVYEHSRGYDVYVLK